MLFPGVALADFIVSAGLHGGTIESENSSPAGNPVAKTGLFGFKGEIEFGSPWVAAFGSFDFGAGSGETQYNFVNQDNPTDQATVNDLDTTSLLSRFSVGVRVKLIKLQNFRFFIGGGAQYGLLSFVYEKDDFKKKNGSTTGYEESEQNKVNGLFGQAGFEIILNQNSGLRVIAQRTSLKTDKFETLGNERLKFNFTTISLGYIQYIDTN